MSDRTRLADAAKTFVGVPFKLHGRDPAYGLDCVGLLSVCLKAIGRDASTPRGYRLRNSSIDRWLALAPQCGLGRARDAITCGDVILCQPGPGQHHLMIAVDSGNVIHAHAGLRRVVSQPIPTALRPIGHWRLTGPNEEL